MTSVPPAVRARRSRDSDRWPAVSMMRSQRWRPGYDYGDEYLFGLELILDGLDRARSQAR